MRFYIALVASRFIFSAVPARAADCAQTVVVIDGRAFTPETVLAPGFDAKTAPTAPWCDGVLGPSLDGQRIVEAEKKLRVAEIDEAAAKDDLAREREKHAEDLAADKATLDVSEKARRACETAQTPTCPTCEEHMGAGTGFLIGGGVVAVALTILYAATR